MMEGSQLNIQWDLQIAAWVLVMNFIVWQYFPFLSAKYTGTCFDYALNVRNGHHKLLKVQWFVCWLQCITVSKIVMCQENMIHPVKHNIVTFSWRYLLNLIHNIIHYFHSLDIIRIISCLGHLLRIVHFCVWREILKLIYNETDAQWMFRKIKHKWFTCAQWT